MDYKSIEKLVRQAGKMMLDAHLNQSQIQVKQGDANFCTEYDVKIQRFLIGNLKELLPEAGFYGEEETENNRENLGNCEYVFYIDPIDGTTNFMFGYHHSCVSVGLAHWGVMEAGFVYNPYVDEMYTAVRGQGSYLNGRKLTVDNVPIEKGLVAFGCARYNDNGTNLLFDSLKILFDRSLAIRSGGSATLDLCRVASGNNAVFLELRLQPYDYAAAAVIVEEAGGQITQVDGMPITLDKPCSVICGTPAAWQEAKEILNRP